MRIFLLGYMASGKTTIGKLLSQTLGFNFIDLDDYITSEENKSISDIFDKQGEIGFRKLEKFYLEKLLSINKNTVISLGGGTPCYYNFVERINQSENNLTIYLKTPLKELVLRLIKEKEHRPLINHLENEEIEEFVGKHLFERSFYYNQATLVIENINPKETVEEIVKKLTKLKKL